MLTTACVNAISDAPIPPIFTNCDFFDCFFDCRPMNATDRPVVIHQNSIAWPSGWTVEMANEYRCAHGFHKSLESAR